MQIRCLFFIELQTIPDDQPDISPELLITFVNIQVDLVEDGPKVHRLRDNLEVVRTVVPDRVHRLAEKDSIVDAVLGEVEQLRADEHE
jgi:hypothetical protein